MADIDMLALHHATQTTAVVWARSTVNGVMLVTCNGSTFTGDTISTATDDGCGICTVTGLSAGQSYPYSVTVGGTSIGSGTLRTTPADGATFEVGFVTCISHSRDPLPIQVALDRPLLTGMCWLGDQMYADEPKPNAGVYNGETIQALEYYAPLDEAQTMDMLWRHYRVWWQHQSTRRMHQTVPCWFVGDDHDHGPGNGWDGTIAAANANTAWASTQQHVDDMGEWCDTAFNAYCKGNPDNANRYFAVRLNDSTELFFVDGVQWRDAADGTGTTLLGAAQKAWIQAAISTSTATWKIVMCNKNINGWADDFSQYPVEKAEIIAFLSAPESWTVPGGVIWCSGDIHYPHVTYDGTVPILGICSSPLSTGNATPGDGYSSKRIWKTTGYLSDAGTDADVFTIVGIIRITGHERMDVSLVDAKGAVKWTGHLLPGSNELHYDRTKS